MRTQIARLVAVLLLVLLIGGAYYVAVILPGETQPRNAEDARWTTLEPAGTGDTTEAESPSTIGARRGAEIIKCHDPEVGEYYTNAASCEEADVHSRLSIADPLVTHPAQNTYSGQNYTAPAQDAGNSRTDRPRRQAATDDKPNLRLHGKPPPPGLPPECKFPVGKALETERDLAAPDDPYQSKWKDTYCRFRCEAKQKRCPVAEDYYYFDYRRMCRGTDHATCPVFAAKAR